ncbi:undecaprenyl/decaprenyl-phosphate alpha-N-acetylglucosaminyl 1-phosphate transferase [Candidatus Pelagibacter sp.]|nr:undecaprenyl/decaprenyl-phosphate alpha-N-acetylglucosaminyl 1-phosphate transferase [Candidatus Pelagibacter sp.]
MISYKLNLLDIPNKRKNHSRPTAYTGGLAISFAYLCSLQIFDILYRDLNLILSVAFLIAIIGFIDDKFYLKIGEKLSLQIIPIFYMIVFENFSLTQIGNYNLFQLDLESFAIPYTLLCVLFLINAFNYFDGVDGTLSFTSISILAILYFLTSDENIRLFLVTILIPIFIFISFNFALFKLPKLFLGDSGSLLLGFIISFILIFCAKEELIHPILLAWSIALFVYEFLSINLIRLKNRKNLFKAGRDHLHHLLILKTNSIFVTNFLMSISNIVLFTIGYIVFDYFNPLASLLVFMFFFIIFFIFRNYYFTKKI